MRGDREERLRNRIHSRWSRRSPEPGPKIGDSASPSPQQFRSRLETPAPPFERGPCTMMMQSLVAQNSTTSSETFPNPISNTKHKIHSFLFSISSHMSDIFLNS